MKYTGSRLLRVRLLGAPSFNTLGPAYNEFGDNEHPATSFVTTSRFFSEKNSSCWAEKHL